MASPGERVGHEGQSESAAEQGMEWAASFVLDLSELPSTGLWAADKALNSLPLGAAAAVCAGREQLPMQKEPGAWGPSGLSAAPPGAWGPSGLDAAPPGPGTGIS